MATGSELAEQVLDIVQDPSFDEDKVLGLLNKAASQISQQVLLPFLETSAVVIAGPGEDAVSLPSDFQRNLFRCDDETGYNSITILNSRTQIFDQYDFTNPGILIKAVAVVQPNLLYTPTPVAATNLTIHYHRRPDQITADDQVLFLPDGYDDMLISFACWRLYSLVEQGLEGAKIDTKYWRDLYVAQLEALQIAYKQGISMPAPPVSRGERW